MNEWNSRKLIYIFPRVYAEFWILTFKSACTSNTEEKFLTNFEEMFFCQEQMTIFTFLLVVYKGLNYNVK